jgi:ribonuclease HI
MEAQNKEEVVQAVKPSESIAIQGMMIYADGSAAPTNPGPSGWGIHGYLYHETKPKKGSGNSSWNLTPTGYIAKNDPTQKGSFGDITPIHYVDGYGALPGIGTNNLGELAGAIAAMQHAQNYQIAQLQIRTDSEYVRKNANERLERWEKNGWITSSGMPPANLEHWQTFLKIRRELTNKGVDVKFDWVKGHSSHIGNDLADKLANIGSLTASQGEVRAEINTKVADGYWNYDNEKHPFISLPRCYFNTMPGYQVRGEYYLGNHGKEDDMLGKRMADGCYAVVRLKKAEEAIETVRNYSSQLAEGLDTIVMIRLDQLYSANTHEEVLSYGRLAMPRAKSYKLDLNCLDIDPSIRNERKPLTRHMEPARLAMRAVEWLSDLIERLDHYQKRDANAFDFVCTDLTPILYETKEKPNGKKGDIVLTTELREQFGVGFAKLEVQANYQVEGGVAQVPVTLVLGMDLLHRNSLKRLEKMAPKVTLITWLESPRAFRYATVIEVGEDIGIWASVYSNLRVV